MKYVLEMIIVRSMVVVILVVLFVDALRIRTGIKNIDINNIYTTTTSKKNPFYMATDYTVLDIEHDYILYEQWSRGGVVTNSNTTVWFYQNIVLASRHGN